MERIIKTLDENATTETQKTERTRRVLSGIALVILGTLLLGAYGWSTFDRALWYSGVSKLIGIAGIIPLVLGLDRISPGLSDRILGFPGKGNKRR